MCESVPRGSKERKLRKDEGRIEAGEARKARDTKVNSRCSSRVKLHLRDPYSLHVTSCARVCTFATKACDYFR